MPVELMKLSSARIRELSPATTVFLFPVGGVEDHGPHLPVGLDLEEATRLCRLAGERLEHEMPGWSAVLMPAAPLAVDTVTTELAFSVRGYVLRDFLADWCRELMRLGFRHFICFSGSLNPRQLTAIEEAGKMIATGSWWRRLTGRGGSRAYLASASSTLPSIAQVRASPFLPRPAEHGGKRDTAVALALGLEVDPKWSALIPRENPAGGSVLSSAILRWKRSIGGYWGDPAKASEATGHTVLKETVDEVFPKLRAVWEGSNPNLIFRSWYSILPPNKTFFKAWALFLVFLILLIAWMYWSVRVLLS